MKDRNIAVTLECFIRKKGKYLMLCRSSKKRIMPNVWMAPGGHREFNEGLFECARREVLEETGLKIKNFRLKAVGNAYLKDLKQEFYFSFVVADYQSGNLKKKAVDGDFAWFKPTEILKLPNLLAELKFVIPYILNSSKDVISYKAVYKKDNILCSFKLEK